MKKYRHAQRKLRGDNKLSANSTTMYKYILPTISMWIPLTLIKSVIGNLAPQGIWRMCLCTFSVRLNPNTNLNRI